MSRFNTGNPIDSDDPRDRSDNTKNLDQALNSDEYEWLDRLGISRMTWAEIERLARIVTTADGNVVSAQRGTLPNGSDISIANLPGTYILNPNAGYTGTPEGYISSNAYWLTVSSVGNSVGSGSSRYVRQRLEDFNPVRDHFDNWTRRLDTQNVGSSLNAWIRGPRNSLEIYGQRGYPEAGASLGDLIYPGTYILLPGRSFTAVPDGYSQELTYFLSVESVGPTSGEPYGVSRFVKQTLTEFNLGSNGARQRWIRRADTTMPDSTNGQNAWERDKVPDSTLYLPRGTIPPGTSLGSLTAPGLYLGLPEQGYTDTPAPLEASTAFWLDVKAAGGNVGEMPGRFISQEIKEHAATGGVRKSYNRRFDANNPTSQASLSAWKLSGGYASALPGSRIVCFGDSITEALNNSEYSERMAAILSADVLNAGFGGCRMAWHHDGDFNLTVYDPFSMYRLSQRIADDDWDSLIADAVARDDAEGGIPRFALTAERLSLVDWGLVDYAVIFYGTNDFRGTGGLGVPIGSDEDMTGETFKGAINITINNIMTARPNIKLMFVTPLWRSRVSVSGEDSNVTPNGSGVFLREYADAIIERAKAYQIPVLDLHDECGMNILNWEYYMPDGLHPYTDQGMELVAQKISAGLSRYY